MPESVALVEVVVWSGMAGVIAVLSLIALADFAYQRNMGAARSVVFMFTMGASAILLSGLPEALFPTLQADLLLPLKASAGLLSGALALNYLGVWMGPTHDDDRLMRQTVKFGSIALVLAALVLAVLALPPFDWPAGQVLGFSAAISLVMTALALGLSIRGAALGDRLARWMALACVSLFCMLLGLYAKSMGVSLELGYWVLTAMATVAYLLVVSALSIMRTREHHRLKHLASAAVDAKVDISLPQGSNLVSQVDEAIWRSQRADRSCTIAAITVRNLYELSGKAGPGVETEILKVLAARVRRHVGFRNVVGLYHPRCFMLAVSEGQDPKRGELLVSSLLRSMRGEVMVVVGSHRHAFKPSVGVGVVELLTPDMDALTAMNRAEQFAMEDSDEQEFQRALDSQDDLPPSSTRGWLTSVRQAI